MSNEVFAALMSGFSLALSPENLLFGIIGVTLGTAVGVLPGLGSAVAISLLLPLTFGLDPISAFIMFGGIYYGSMYGGAMTAILVNTPGCASSAVSTFDGHPLATSGKAGAALMAAIFGSFFGGTVATFALMMLAPTLVEVSLMFGPPEYFALMLFALTMVVSIGGDSLMKAVFSTFLGIGIAMIGIDSQTGVARMTLGMPELASGINIVLASVGLFAVSEVLWKMSSPQQAKASSHVFTSKLWMTAQEWKKSASAWIRGTLIGFIGGVLPGSGGVLGTFMAYGIEKQISKQPEKFGKGAIEGVAAPEAANNAAAGGSLVPLLALGIPGSATTAVMLVAFQIYGLQPGPLLFENSKELVWGLIASLYIANILLVVLNLPLIGIWVKLLKLPDEILYFAVLIFSTLGAYSLNSSLGDVVIAYCLGALAFTLRKFAFPVAPVLLGVVLGPMIEKEFRRSMSLSSGDYGIFIESPLALSLLVFALLSLSVSLWRKHKTK
jgi:putative tricarboxylic transport membrane protein